MLFAQDNARKTCVEWVDSFNARPKSALSDPPFLSELSSACQNILKGNFIYAFFLIFSDKALFVFLITILSLSEMCTNYVRRKFVWKMYLNWVTLHNFSISLYIKYIYILNLSHYENLLLLQRHKVTTGWVSTIDKLLMAN